MTKFCSGCVTAKDTSYFWKNKSQPDGRDNLCIPCRKDYSIKHKRKNKAKVKEYEKKYQKTDTYKAYKKKYQQKESTKEKNRARMRYRRYGLTDEQYHNMLVTQGGKCKICEKSTKLVIDHSHISGKVRGLLCDPCNKALGFFEDDKQRIKKSLEYLDLSTV